MLVTFSSTTAVQADACAAFFPFFAFSSSSAFFIYLYFYYYFFISTAGPLDSVVPTIGFSNLEMAQFKQFAVELYDLGGGAKIRSIWSNYFALVHGVIYVVDSTDANRLSEVASLLESIMKNELICQKPLLM